MKLRYRVAIWLLGGSTVEAPQSEPPPTFRVPAIREVLDDPSASYWLKNSLETALTRDPVDAANEADVLALVLDRRCRHVLNVGSRL